tara:strand:- start:1019 stop:1360 length:342 start_codon:yes stop_codon:yes gene_type:complete
VLLLKQQIVNDAFELYVKQGVSVRDLHRFHPQLDVFRPLVNHKVSMKQFVPDFVFGRVFPLSIDFNDPASGASNPRNVFGHFRKNGPGAQTRFAHSIAEQRGLGAAHQAKIAP